MSSEPPPIGCSRPSPLQPRVSLARFTIFSPDPSPDLQFFLQRLGQLLIVIRPRGQSDLLDVLVHVFGDRLVEMARPCVTQHARGERWCSSSASRPAPFCRRSPRVP